MISDSWAGRPKKEICDGALRSPCKDDSAGGLQNPGNFLHLRNGQEIRGVVRPQARQPWWPAFANMTSLACGIAQRGRRAETGRVRGVKTASSKFRPRRLAR